jgi:hypothetical protein
VADVVFTGSDVLSAAADGLVHLWRPGRSEPVARHASGRGAVTCMARHAGLVATGLGDDAGRLELLKCEDTALTPVAVY